MGRGFVDLRVVGGNERRGYLDSDNARLLERGIRTVFRHGF